MTNLKRPLWTDLWDLSTDMVTCKECYASQPMVYRELAFTHEASCSHEGTRHYPYLEILEILKMMQHADRPPPGTQIAPVWTPPKG
jgi:hypothetical protein